MLLVLLLCLATLAVEAQGDDDICAICTRSGSECIEPDGRTPYCGGPLWPQDRKKRNALVKPPVRCVLPNRKGKAGQTTPGLMQTPQQSLYPSQTHSV
ncbi:unnamed protein product, partial [Mesorhabditis spiculigera]